MTEKPNNGSVILIVSFWLIVIWSIGIWQDWWTIGWKSIGIAFGVFICFLFSLQKKTYNPKSEIDCLKKGQLRQLRNLMYKASPHWKTDRVDDLMWIGVRFFPNNPGPIINIHVRWVGDNEDTTPEGLMAYARRHYDEQMGYVLEKNEIIDFKGKPCVFSECSAIGPGSYKGKVRRYSTTVLGSEYGIQFTGEETNFSKSESLINCFLENCHFVFPDLKEHVILKNRIIIGIPEGNKNITNEDNLSIWKLFAGPIFIRFYYIGMQGSERMSIDIFKNVPEFKEKKNCCVTRYRIEEQGLAVLNFAIPEKDKWSIDSVKLPSGNVIILEFENMGNEDLNIQGFLLEPLKRSIIASIRDNDVPIL